MRPPSSVMKSEIQRSGMASIACPIEKHSAVHAVFGAGAHTSRTRPPKTAMKHAENAPINSETKSHNAAYTLARRARFAASLAAPSIATIFC